MKSTELRVGNWVIFNTNNRPFQITAAGILDLFTYEGKQMPYDYQPIPLTEEWLIKFGFEKPAHSWNGKIFHLSEWDQIPNNWMVAMDKNGAVLIHKLKYVHQLQNLYFALTNEELTITQ